MKAEVSYVSLAVKLFDTWRIFFYGMISVSLLSGTLIASAQLGILIGFVLMSIVATIHIAVSYSKVTIAGNSIEIRDLRKVVSLDNYKTMKSWWCYDFSGGSIELSEGTQGNSRALTNKINYYVKFKSDMESVIIYEQIHLAEKFPNGHVYLPDEKIDKSRLVRVWDLDNCLRKLNLEVIPEN